MRRDCPSRTTWHMPAPPLRAGCARPGYHTQAGPATMSLPRTPHVAIFLSFIHITGKLPVRTRTVTDGPLSDRRTSSLIAGSTKGPEPLESLGRAYALRCSVNYFCIVPRALGLRPAAAPEVKCCTSITTLRVGTGTSDPTFDLGTSPAATHVYSLGTTTMRGMGSPPEQFVARAARQHEK